MAPRELPALDLEVPLARSERVTVVLWEAGTTGIEELGHGRWRAHFPSPPDAGVLARLGAAGARAIERVGVPLEDWVAMGRARVRAVRVGRILVRPPWSRARPRPRELEIVIDPARAFGTANHESTRLVLGVMQGWPLAGRTLLDVGCGSGILALAALGLGARRVVACDIDPDSVEATAENAARNRLEAGLRVTGGTAAAVRGRFAVVLANLTADVLEQEAAALACRLGARGSLVIAGFLERDRGRMAEAFGRQGLAVARDAAENEWLALELRHDAGREP